MKVTYLRVRQDRQQDMPAYCEFTVVSEPDDQNPAGQDPEKTMLRKIPKHGKISPAPLNSCAKAFVPR